MAVYAESNHDEKKDKDIIEWADRCVRVNSVSVIKVSDNNQNKDPKVKEWFDIEIWSDSDKHSINQTLIETDNNTGIFEGTVFLYRYEEKSPHRVLAFSGDTVYAKYVDETRVNNTNAIDSDLVAEIPVLEWTYATNLQTITYEPCTVSIVKKILQDTTIQREIFFPAPLKQIQSGLHSDEIQCKEQLILVAKHNGSPACVKEDSIPKLIERSWISETVVSFCFMEELHVCGVDGNTYGNLCLLNKADVQLHHDGKCTSHDTSHENIVQPEKIIVEVLDRHYTEQVFPIRITEVVSGITDNDKIQTWFFLPLDMGEKIRDWNFVTNSVFGIVDKDGNNAIEMSVNQDLGYLNDVSRGSQITCNNGEKISMKYRTPSVVDVKDNITETYGVYSNIGFPPSLYKNETLKIASFFDQDIILPDHALLISNRSEICAVNHMGFTEAHYDEVIFQFTK